MTITIVNLINDKKVDFMCDRSSPLGNPFYITRDTTRDDVCNKYFEYFYNNLNPDVAPDRFLEYLDRILQAAKERDITLGCWCAPKRCHCETIKEYVEAQVDAKV